MCNRNNVSIIRPLPPWKSAHWNINLRRIFHWCITTCNETVICLCSPAWWIRADGCLIVLPGPKLTNLPIFDVPYIQHSHRKVLLYCFPHRIHTHALSWWNTRHHGGWCRPTTAMVLHPRLRGVEIVASMQWNKATYLKLEKLIISCFLGWRQWCPHKSAHKTLTRWAPDSPTNHGGCHCWVDQYHLLSFLPGKGVVGSNMMPLR